MQLRNYQQQSNRGLKRIDRLEMQNLPFRWTSLPDSSRCNVQSVDLSTERGPFEKLYSLSIRKDPRNYPLNWILLTSKFRHESGDFDDWNMIRIQKMINNLLNNRLNHRIVRRILFFPLIRLPIVFLIQRSIEKNAKNWKKKAVAPLRRRPNPFFLLRLSPFALESQEIRTVTPRLYRVFSRDVW